jgi:DNA polymerase-3 subunit delta'
MSNLYKWQYNDYLALSQNYKNPSQTLLLSAMPGVGLEVLAENYLALLMCDTPVTKDNVLYACARCQSCVLLENKNNPDVYYLVPEEDKKNISIEDVRLMLEFLSTTTHLGRHKIVVIPNVDLLNISSANALLKILEEPPSYAIFILQTTNVSGILATIKSRCHIYKLSATNSVDAISYVKDAGVYNPEFWLTYYDNAPLFELEITEDQFTKLMQSLLKPSIENIFIASNEFDAKSAGFLIGFFNRWLNDLASHLQGLPMRYFAAYVEQVDSLANRIDRGGVFYLFDQVNFLEDWTLHPLNYKLQLENLLLQYQSLFITK